MRFILIIVIAAIFFACKKDKFTTKPQLIFKSVNRTTVSGSEVIVIKLTLTDKEGDFTTLLGYKKTVAGCALSNRLDSTFFQISPDFISSKENEGEVTVTLDKNIRGANSCFVPGGGIRPDTSVYSFWTKDKAGNISDTTRTPQIIILN